MKEEEKQQEKEDEAEVKEEVPGGNPEDESTRTCYTEHPLREQKKSVDGLVNSGAPPKLYFFVACLALWACLARSQHWRALYNSRSFCFRRWRMDAA